MKALLLFIIINFIGVSLLSQVGPYSPSANVIGTTAIYKDSNIISGWADICTVTRGWQDITDTTLGKTNVGTNSNALGKADGSVISLGDSGIAIVEFNTPIKNVNGADFAIFENAFNHTFLELAFVEISNDGNTYYRFPAKSITDASTQIGSFGNVDASNIHNLAGKYIANYGTPFDIDEVNQYSGIQLDNVSHIKIIDVIGNINAFEQYDIDGNIINDPFPTPFPSGGFDLDAVASINQNVSNIHELNQSTVIVFPNPFNDYLNITGLNNTDYRIIDITGRSILEGKGNRINTSSLNSGVYYLLINQVSIKIIKS